MAKTTVYQVKLYDVATDEVLVSRRSGQDGGWIVEGTGFVIDQTDLESGEEWTARDFDPRNLGYKKVQG